LDLVGPRLGRGRGRVSEPEGPGDYINATHADYMARYYKKDDTIQHVPPFELEVLEAALLVATGA
jgi:hypothetical protein